MLNFFEKCLHVWYSGVKKIVVDYFFANYFFYGEFFFQKRWPETNAQITFFFRNILSGREIFTVNTKIVRFYARFSIIFWAAFEINPIKYPYLQRWARNAVCFFQRSNATPATRFPGDTQCDVTIPGGVRRGHKTWTAARRSSHVWKPKHTARPQIVPGFLK